MQRSKTASRTVKAMVASKPKGQFSAMLAREPQLAAKFKRQSKMKPMKKAIVKATVSTMNTSEVHWKPGHVKMRRYRNRKASFVKPIASGCMMKIMYTHCQVVSSEHRSRKREELTFSKITRSGVVL
jgi:hypothetical protein